MNIFIVCVSFTQCVLTTNCMSATPPYGKFGAITPPYHLSKGGELPITQKQHGYGDACDSRRRPSVRVGAMNI